ncbi:unnamed protein product [Gongylonema pulchrum]|uniref:T-box domain-containing protein n=1 Tax=Gongylonema pulchrum TaxID=637853 RepID=A0A183D5F7_9BILA|nr:unnamed protein product [Gongylonema pulchrum]
MNQNYGLSEKVETVSGDDKISVDIPHRRLWEEFHCNNNEMILTNKGRCVYPRIAYNVKGLDLKSVYAVCLKICRADCTRFIIYM